MLSSVHDVFCYPGKSAPPVDDLDELLDAFEGHSKVSNFSCTRLFMRSAVGHVQ